MNWLFGNSQTTPTPSHFKRSDFQFDAATFFYEQSIRSILDHCNQMIGKKGLPSSPQSLILTKDACTRVTDQFLKLKNEQSSSSPKSTTTTTNNSNSENQQEEEKTSSGEMGNLLEKNMKQNPNLYFKPLECACKTRDVILQKTAIDCLQKMMAYGYLNTSEKYAPNDYDEYFEHKETSSSTTSTLTSGQAEAEEEEAEAEDGLLVNVVIKTICGCLDVQNEDSSLQLPILSALLASVTSCSDYIHGKTLRLIVRTCFNIHLVSRNIINQKTANATLSQMLNSVFMKMEESAKHTATTSQQHENQSEERTDQTIEDGGTVEEDDGIGKMSKGYLLDDEEPEEDEELLTLKQTIQEQENRRIQLEDEKVAQKTISAIVEQIVESVVQMNEGDRKASESIARHGDEVDSGKRSTVAPKREQRFKSIHERDAFYIFKSLCRISMRKLKSSHAESFEMRSRVLSLQLLQETLENAGPVFRQSPLFIREIKSYLCLSLLKNSVSAVPVVFKLSLNIFKSLILHFKQHLKTEIGMFFTNSFFQILQSSNSTYQQRLIVVKMLQAIGRDEQTLVDLFVNYDCALESVNVYETCISDLARVVQETHAETNWITPEQELNLKRHGMEGLVSAMKSLVQWTNTKKHLLKQKHRDEEKREEDVGQEDEETERFEEQRHKKLDMTEGVKLFNKKPSHGIKFLIQANILPEDAHSIAEFLLSSKGLSKKMIGEYIGSSTQFQNQVLHEFVHLHSFLNQDFETAIRSFLNSFRLAGEAQMIDRVLQKFAEKYYQDNPESVFANADAAYVFAYSVIMLNTELHSQSIGKRERMSEQGFIINNGGINDGSNLPEEYLVATYNAIKSREITLKEEDEISKQQQIDRRVGASNMSTKRKKQILFSEESKKIYKQGKSILKTNKKSGFQMHTMKAKFYNATGMKHVRSMFEISWGPVLAAINNVLDKHENNFEMTKLALEALNCCIHISARFDLEVERNAFVAALTKSCLSFTQQNTQAPQVHLQKQVSTIAPWKQKNIDSIHLLIKVADTEGNYLGSSWSSVLDAISQLDRLQVVSSHISGPAPISSEENNKNQNNASGIDVSMLPRDGGPSSKSNNLGFDKIFAKSADLNDDAIVDFVRCLCNVAHEELFDQSLEEPRQFSLHKIIEVAYYNMKRIKIVWSQLWQNMSELFIAVGCHSNQYVSMRGIDSLKIMAIKFLEQDELANYHFQRDFLRPFMEIMRQSERVLNRDLVVQCIGYIIMKRAKSIKSGWRIILQVLATAAKLSDSEVAAKGQRLEESIEVVKLSFNYLSIIIKEYFHLISEAFEDCITCLVAFIKQRLQPNISVQAIQLMLQCARKIVSGEIEGIPAEQQKDEPDGVLFVDSREHFRVWFPLLLGLQSTVTGDSRVPVRRSALTALFDVLIAHGASFSSKLWDVIFSGVLMPIFDEVKIYQEERSEDPNITNEWISTTCANALNALVDIVVAYHYRISSSIFSDVLILIDRCCQNIGKDSKDELGNTGCSSLLRLVNSANKLETRGETALSEKEWTAVCRLLISIFNRVVIYKKEASASTMLLVLKCYLCLSDDLFAQNIDEIYPLWCDLIVDAVDTQIQEQIKLFFVRYRTMSVIPPKSASTK